MLFTFFNEEYVDMHFAYGFCKDNPHRESNFQCHFYVNVWCGNSN